MPDAFVGAPWDPNYEWTRKGSPVGFTFIGRAWQETKLLRYAYDLEQELNAREQPQYIGQLSLRNEADYCTGKPKMHGGTGKVNWRRAERQSCRTDCHSSHRRGASDCPPDTIPASHNPGPANQAGAKHARRCFPFGFRSPSPQATDCPVPVVCVDSPGRADPITRRGGAEFLVPPRRLSLKVDPSSEPLTCERGSFDFLACYFRNHDRGDAGTRGVLPRDSSSLGR